MTEKTTLYRCACGQEWTRERARGAGRVLACPAGCDVALAEEVHRCETCGEEWTRKPTKGQRPKSGPCCRVGSGRRRRVKCWVCGTETVRSPARLYQGGRIVCSDLCKTTVRLGLGAYPAAHRRPAETTVFTGTCARCGEGFAREFPAASTPPRFCSWRCRERESNSRRGHAKRGAVGTVSTAEVHARDAWVCYLCGEATDPGDWTTVLDRRGLPARVVGPWYPTLDHVEPLAHGGEHTMANLRTAHFLCNARKRDLPLADLL